MDNCNQMQNKGKLHSAPNLMGVFALSNHKRNIFCELDIEMGQTAAANEEQFIALSALSILCEFTPQSLI